MVVKTRRAGEGDPALADLFLLDRSIAHLNHGGFGASPAPVVEARERRQREIERHPSAAVSRTFKYDELMHGVRAALAESFGCPVDELALTRNTTDGINAAARSIHLDPGDEVLSTNQEYAALENVWEYRCHETRARFVRQPLPLDDPTSEQLFGAVWSGVSDRTRVLFVSHVTSETSLAMPVDRLCREARRQGIITVIDGAHGPAQLDLDLTAVGADIYAASCHKWICGPRGTGFLHVRAELHDIVRGSLISHGDVPGATFQERMAWQGTIDPSPFLAVPVALQLVTSDRWIRARDQCRQRATDVAGEIEDRFGLGQIGRRGPESATQMVSVPIPPCDAETTRRALFVRHGVDAPIRTRNGRSFVRASLQVYNSYEDTERLLAALEAEVGMH